MSGYASGTSVKWSRAAPRPDAIGTQPAPERPLARIRSAALRTAARNAVDAFRAEGVADWDEDQLLRETAELALAVHEGREPALGEAPPNRTVARRRLLELLRAALIRVWSEPARGAVPAPARMVALLRGFETARQALERNGRDDALAPLLSAAGLELTVELAHDLRSPLTSILFLAEALQRGQSGEINDVQRRELGIIYSAALEVVSVANDIVKLARGDQASVHAEPTAFAIGEVIHSVREIVAPMAEEKGVELRDERPTIDHRRGQPVPLSRVMLNLTTNAIKATDHGWIQLGARPTGPDRVEFWVQDTGPGIDDAQRAQLYRPFRSGRDGEGHSFSSVGLGLAICRKLVRGMGSELRCETEPGRGTRFSFEVELPPVEPI